MLLKKSTLTDSVNLFSVSTDKFKTGILAFTVRIPTSPRFTPYALLLTEMLQRATESYPSKVALSRRLDELYSASVGIRTLAKGKNRIFTVTAEILDDAYSSGDIDITTDVCRLLCDILLRPLLDEDGLFPENAFEQEKRRTAAALRSLINNPRDYAARRLSELMHRGDPDALTLEQTIETVEKCDRETLTEFYRSTLTCRPIDVYYVGTLSDSEISEKVTSVLGSYNATVRDELILLSGAYPEREVAYKDEKMPISQGRLAIGLSTDVCFGTDDYFSMLLFNEIFGGSPSSKLFMNVREKMSLCYSCSSQYFSDNGGLRAMAGISPENREIAQKAILSELDNIKNGNISDKELISAKKALENSIREIYDSPIDIFDFYFSSACLGIELTIEEYISKISALTKNDAVAAASKVRLDSVYFLSGDGDADEEDCDE